MHFSDVSFTQVHVDITYYEVLLANKLRKLLPAKLNEHIDYHSEILVSKLRETAICTRQLPTQCTNSISCSKGVNSIVLLEESIVATCHYNCDSIKLYDIAAGTQYASIKVQSHIHELARVGEDHILCAAYLNSLILVNWRTKKIVDCMTPGRNLSGCVTHSKMKCFGRDDRYVIACLDDKTIGIFDLQTKGMKQVRLFAGEHTQVLTCLEIASKNRFCSAGKDDYICVWDMIDGKCSRKLTGFDGYITAMCLVDEFTIASGNNTGGIWLWDLETGTCVSNFKLAYPAVTCEMNRLSSTKIAVSDSTSAVTIWDIPTKSVVNTFSDKSGWAYSVLHLKSKHHTFLVSGHDKALKIWSNYKVQCCLS
jgi:hypothetical protein